MVNIYLTNLKKYNEGEIIGKWLELPYTEEELQDVLTEIGINDEYEEYFITDFDTEIKGLHISEYENIEELNEKIALITNLEEWDQEKLFALIEYDSSYLNNIENTIDKLEDVYLYNDVTTDEDLGYYYIDNGFFAVEIPESLTNYIDYESIGCDMRINNGGDFTSYGFLEVA